MARVVLVGERDVPRLLDVLTGEVEESSLISTTGGRTSTELIIGHRGTEVTKPGTSRFLRYKLLFPL